MRVLGTPPGALWTACCGHLRDSSSWTLSTRSHPPDPISGSPHKISSTGSLHFRAKKGSILQDRPWQRCSLLVVAFPSIPPHYLPPPHFSPALPFSTFLFLLLPSLQSHLLLIICTLICPFKLTRPPLILLPFVAPCPVPLFDPISGSDPAKSKIFTWSTSLTHTHTL